MPDAVTRCACHFQQWATQLDGETNASSLEEGGKQHLQDHHRLLLQMEAELARQEKVRRLLSKEAGNGKSQSAKSEVHLSCKY